MHHDITKMSAMMLQGLQVCKNITVNFIDVRYELNISCVSQNIGVLFDDWILLHNFSSVVPYPFGKRDLMGFEMCKLSKMQSNKVWLSCVCIFLLATAVCIL